MCRRAPSMHPILENPFSVLDIAVKEMRQETANIIVDAHGETTSERIALGRYLDGRVSAVLGTHTHVQTADARISRGNGTAFICDAGMCGPIHSILGLQIEPIWTRFLSNDSRCAYRSRPGIAHLRGVLLEIDETTGRACASRVDEPGDAPEMPQVTYQRWQLLLLDLLRPKVPLVRILLAHHFAIAFPTFTDGDCVDRSPLFGRDQRAPTIRPMPTSMRSKAEAAKNKQWDKAIEAFQKAVRDPKEANNYNNLGLAYKALVNWMRRSKRLQVRSKRSPTRLAASPSIAASSVARKKNDKAIEDFTHVIKLDPGNIPAIAIEPLPICRQVAAMTMQSMTTTLS